MRLESDRLFELKLFLFEKRYLWLFTCYFLLP
jgi:hypothetical protein